MYQAMAASHQHQIEIYGVPVKGRELLGVLHLKGFIFDDTLLYSGASLNDIYLHPAGALPLRSLSPDPQPGTDPQHGQLRG